MRVSAPAVIAGTALFAAWTSLSHAGQFAYAAADISDVEPEQRLQFIETRLGGLEPNARRWQYGWTGFYAASALGQAVVAIDEGDNDDETNYIVGAVKATGALAQLLVKPLPAAKSYDRFRPMPAQTRAERLLRLEQGEALLQENAARRGNATF